MPTVNDGWDALLLGSFLFGLLFSVVSLVLGDATSVDVPDDGGDLGGTIPCNLSTVLAFVGWFGGVGYLARSGFGWPTAASLGVGVVGGLVGAALIGWFLLKVVRPNDRALDPADFRLPGTLARVNSAIRAGGTGEVLYEQAGVRQVTAARAADGRAIGRGTEVIVLRTERGVALVAPAAALIDDDPPARVATGPTPAPSGLPDTP